MHKLLLPMVVCLLSTDITYGIDLEKFSRKEAFQEFAANNLPMRDGKLVIPDHIKHIKLDIGLSYNAPMSQQWLSHEEDLMVFGFEPNPDSVISILSAAGKRHPNHGEPLESKYLNNSFFLLPCALGLSEDPYVQFYVTKEDCGCSSVFEPVYFEVEQVIDVPIFTLSDFFDLFPFDTHPVIDYIKLDTQGSDLNIAKSAGDYLKERVVFITLEAENGQYKNTQNSERMIDMFMAGMGFIRFRSGYTSDPTYLNRRFVDYAKEHNVKIFQRG